MMPAPDDCISRVDCPAHDDGSVHDDRFTHDDRKGHFIDHHIMALPSF